MEDAVYREFLQLEQSHWWFQGRRAIFISLLDRYVGRKPDSGRWLMDLGCGVGGMIEPLGEYGTVIGTDVMPTGLRYCADRGFSLLVACTGHELPFEDESLDCITAFDALEHIEDDVGALREIHRILKPGGIVIASGPAYQFLYAQQDRVTHHVRRYTRGEMTAKAERAGFEVMQASYINFILFPLILPAVLGIKIWQRFTNPSDDGAGSNVGIGIPGFVNNTLSAIFRSEARLLRLFSSPTGHSLIVVARKPG